jgi:glycosyltransferase involved in cell wall biosynthesis
MIRNGLKLAIYEYLYVDKSVSTLRENLLKIVYRKSNPVTYSNSQLLVDVSEIIRMDLRTGIQRVVRAIIYELNSNSINGFTVRLIFARTNDSFRYVPNDFDFNKNNQKIDIKSCTKVSVLHGDIFIALDLATQQISANVNQLMQWKRDGVAIHVMVFDLLPVLQPKWFHSRTTRNFYRWLRTIAIVADTLLCISNTVKHELASWNDSKYSVSTFNLPIKVLPMGCDFESTYPSLGLPADSELILKHISESLSALMVGTIEPRKGHKQVLNAFEMLWKQGHMNKLVIVGRPGWKTQKLQNQLINHPELGKRLFWLKNVSDEYLDKIYQNIYGLIVASEGEGYGLPLIEALKYDKPLLVRDLPVFRELNVTNNYFHESNEIALSAVISNWFENPKTNELTTAGSTLLWRDTVNEMLSHILDIHKTC